MIVVTHEMGFAREVGDSLVFMDDGVVVEAGSPREVLANPQHDRTKAFLSKVLWDGAGLVARHAPRRAGLSRAARRAGRSGRARPRPAPRR